MSISLPFANNNIQVYAYEGFDYVISNLNQSYTLQPVSNSSGLNPTSLYFTKNDNDNYQFAVPDLSMNLTAGTTESFVVSTVSGSTVVSSSNTVVVSPGRFLDGSGNTLSNRSFTFFKNEAITRIRVVAPSFKLKQPTSIPTLPPGISFVKVDSNIYDISGVPLVTVPNSNYQIIGVQDGGSKVVTTRINMAISNERVQLSLDGTPIINNMQIGTPIATRVLTAIPPLGTSVLRYTFPSLPEGIVITDLSGTIRNSPYFPSDPSYTLIVSGTPTSNAAYAYRNAGATSNGFVYTVQASRVVPTPLVENSQALQIAFGETILFDETTVPPLYVGVPVLQSFRAQTYFTSNVDISSIFSPDLRSDLSLVFIPGTGRADLSGIPTSVGSATYTFRAINSNGLTRDYQTPITVSNDNVVFTSPVGTDLCYSFILSRPVEQEKTGYYPSIIKFSAVAASGRNVTLSAPSLNGTGLSLNANGVLSGIPSAVTPLTDLAVTATVVGSPASATKTVKFSILNDVFTFGNVSPQNLSFLQNIPIVPFQFPVTTLSGRNVIDYSQTGLPSGLIINPAGVLSGIPSSSSPTSGNSTITATTGFASGSRDFSYNITPDVMLFIVNPPDYVYTGGQSIGAIQIDAVAYSGTTVTRYDLSINPTYGMNLNPSTGVLSGTWTDSIPPNDILPSSCNFTVNAHAGSLVGVLPARITANPVVSNVMLFAGYGNPSGEDDFNSWMYTTTPSAPSVFTSNGTTATSGISDIRFKSNNPNSNIILATTTGSSLASGQVLRGTTITGLSPVSVGIADDIYPNWSKVVNKTGTSTWWVGGTFLIADGYNAAIVPSYDDGLTWDISSASILSNTSGQKVFGRDSNRAGSTGWNQVYDPYIRGGMALAYKNDVLMAGGLYDGTDGHVMLRSTNDGSTWSNVTGEFGMECANFSLDNSSVWVATGSSLYKSINVGNGTALQFSSATDTIKYSIDQGVTWTSASNAFNMFGYELIYANNTWLATGVSSYMGQSGTSYIPELRYSSNGSNWTKVTLSSTDLFIAGNSSPIVAPLRLGSMNFDGNFWNVFVNAQSQQSGNGSIPLLFRHDTTSDLSGNWTSIDISSSFIENEPQVNDNLRYLSLTQPSYVYSAQPPITINLGFTTSLGPGPTIVEPTVRSFLQYQYIPIQPIQLSAAGTDQVYFFVTTDDLPPGLTFNPLTNQITGTPAKIGQVVTTVYAKNNTGDGVTSFTLSFNTIIARVIRKQDGAGAYTSLLRQYTDVLGAQNARDNRVLPNQERTLGEFMSPEAPDVVTQTNGCCPK